MPVDPCFTALLADRRSELRAPPARVSLADVREANKTFLLQAPAPLLYAVEELAAVGPAGPIAMRAYRPSAARSLPAILFFHGGGFVLGDLDTHDALCRSLALRADCVVVSVDYRRAPETKFPGPVEDCHAALGWLAAHAWQLDIDAGRLAICGDSAGANLAVAAALLARSRGPRVHHLALLYPITDAACTTASMREFARGYVLTRDAVQWFWSSYLGNPGDAANPLASILRAELAGLPTMTVVTAEFDPLRDEGEAFADRLRTAGVTVLARRYAGMIHGFAGMPHMTSAAERALRDIATDIQATYGTGVLPRNHAGR
jgi:acetyl esterase